MDGEAEGSRGEEQVTDEMRDKVWRTCEALYGKNARDMRDGTVLFLRKEPMDNGRALYSEVVVQADAIAELLSEKALRTIPAHSPCAVLDYLSHELDKLIRAADPPPLELAP